MRHDAHAFERSGYRIHIYGPSGSGTSTLGRALAAALASQHFDADDFYWSPTDPPFTEKRTTSQRLSLMEAMFLPRRDWILSGSIEGWGDPVASRINLGIHLSLEPEMRRNRLERRETARCSCGRGWGQPFCARCTAFLCWADRYEQGDRPGRSLERDRRWGAQLDCPVIHIDSGRPVEQLVRTALDRLDQIAALA